MIWLHPTHQPTHPPTHQTIHPSMGGEVSTDFKSSNKIEISWLVQVLLNFDWFWGSLPWGVGGWVDGGVVRRCPPTHVHMHMHACMCMHIWHHRESPGFPQIQWGQPFAWNYHVYHACMCMCVCVHVHVCAHVWGHPQPPPSPHPPTPPPPRGIGSPKCQNSITLELIEIIRFCLKIIYLWTFLNSFRL